MRGGKGFQHCKIYTEFSKKQQFHICLTLFKRKRPESKGMIALHDQKTIFKRFNGKGKVYNLFFKCRIKCQKI